MKFFQRFFNILLVALVILIIGVAAVCMYVDPNRLKPLITAEVHKRTEYQLDIDGNFTWSFYPRLGIKAEGMRLTAPKQKKPFVEMRDVVLGMDFVELLQGKSKLSGEVHAKHLSLVNLHARNVSAEIEWEDGALTISPISAMLYHGWMAATIHGRDLRKTPQWDWDVQFNRVQLKPFLRDLNGKNSKLQLDGLGQLHMTAETHGFNKSDIVNRMDGKLNYSLTNGTVAGIDLNYIVGTAVELIKKKPVNSPGNTFQTSFESMTGSMKINHGLAITDDTVLVAPAFTVKALGTIDLSRQDIDYNLNVVPLHLEKFKWSIPVALTGDLHSPSIKLDMAKLNTVIANEQFQRLKEKTEENLKKLPQRVDKFLQQVLGSDQ